MTIRVLDPTVTTPASAETPTAGLRSLVGRTVGLLDNGKLNASELLDHAAALLQSRYGVAHIVRLRKPDASRPAPPEIVAAMRNCDALVSAVGD